MSKVLVTESSLQGIGDALRRRYGNSNTYKPAQMEAAVDAVPNSYAAGDEGKVVSNGALVSQTTHAEITENGTYDITTNNSVTVNVSGGGGKNIVNTSYTFDLSFETTVEQVA